MIKPCIAISSCLLGERTRHNGEHKRNDWLVDHLGGFVTWISICPEVEMGLGVPRESMHLEGSSRTPRLMTVRTRRDLTELAESTAQRLLKPGLDPDAFILKKDSPSCGVERVKVYGKSGIPSRTGVGMFARTVKVKFPLLPIIEEGRLSDRAQREAFMTQVFGWARLRRLERRIPELQNFHQSYKLLLMAQNPVFYARLGRIAANSARKSASDCFEEYARYFLQALQTPVTTKKRVNALQHMFGYFKDLLDAAEKKQVLEVIEEYRNGETTLVAPLTLIHHLARRHSVEYLKGQTIFEPFPRKLAL